jgi:mono/diheme cytochrome c family protein
MRFGWRFIAAGMVAAASTGLIGVAPAVAQTPAAARRAEPSAASVAGGDAHASTIRTYCVTCHNQRLRTASLALDSVDMSAPSAAPAVWEKVIQKLRTRTMPPIGSRRPDEASYDAVASWLETSLDRAAARQPNPGRPELGRLNRVQYHRVIRDLLGLDVDVTELLPADDSAFGFDNIGDALSVSPVLLESYLNAARKISRLAVGTSSTPVASSTYRTAADLAQSGHLDGLLPGTRGGLIARHNFPLDAEYEIRVRLARTTLNAVRGVDEEQQVDLTLDGNRVELFSVGGTGFSKVIGRNDQSGGQGLSKAFAADEHLWIRVPVKAGSRELAATFVARPSAYAESAPRILAAVDRIIVTGPYTPATDDAVSSDTDVRRRIFICQPSTVAQEVPCARRILSRLGRLAYRRPLHETDVSDLLRFFRDGRRGGSFDSGIELALRRMLASPQFVFRFEDEPATTPASGPYRLDDVALASRLSFFLWSSMPDEALLAFAERRRLSDRAVLAQQVRRMLADSRSDALVTQFAGQWLLTRNVGNLKPNPAEFPEFDDNLRQAFRTETEWLLRDVMRGDKSVLALLNADYTYVNERLARHYGMPGIYGDQFRRVTVADENRRGLLGHGSILSVTSYATRTSPVLRGKWILENLLGAPPPAPPPNVPELRDDPDTATMSMRERMAQHRQNPVCASCHARMDPLGFALENFDAVGKWRSTGDERTPIDTSGTMPDGTPFNGPADLRKVLAAKPTVFINALTEKLLTFAIGRGLEYYDAPSVRAIVQASADQGFTWSSLVQGVVSSAPFQMKRAGSHTPAPVQ